MMYFLNVILIFSVVCFRVSHSALPVIWVRQNQSFRDLPPLPRTPLRLSPFCQVAAMDGVCHFNMRLAQETGMVRTGL